MANTKISNLTSASTPLAGTEVLPIVQSGATVKATIANIVGAGTSPGSFTSLAYTTTLTGGTGIVNLGTGQFYKDANGNVGIGSTSTNGFGLRLSNSIGTTATTYGVYSGNTHQATSTTSINGVVSQQSTVAASFTVTNLRNFYAVQGTIGLDRKSTRLNSSHT